ncbi:TetR/AcrR family transcriptional regulator [Hoyosella rhizosphaerae]|nr:TetR/AcrR family transcriptional regulator [Hoyosella rhizosphaerae]
MPHESRVSPRRKYAPRMPLEQRKEQLLDAALRVLVRDGYGNASIDAIAREANVTRPVVYSAYDGLEPLLHALLDRTQQRAFDQAMRILSGLGAPVNIDKWVLDGASALIDQVQSDPDVWRPILGLTKGAPVMVTERIETTREELRSYLASGLQAGLELRGGPAIDAEVLSHLLLATAEEFGRLSLETPPRFSKQRLVDTLSTLLAAVPPGP